METIHKKSFKHKSLFKIIITAIMISLLIEFFITCNIARKVGKNVRPLAVQDMKISRDIMYFIEVTKNCKDDSVRDSLKSKLVVLSTITDIHYHNNKINRKDATNKTEAYIEYSDGLDRITKYCDDISKELKDIDEDTLNTKRDIETDRIKISEIDAKYRDYENVDIINIFKKRNIENK